jgi:transcriptional regulator of acetoin/glycerol metabolism
MKSENRSPAALYKTDTTIVPINDLIDQAVRHALWVWNGKVELAAKDLGMGRATLYRRLSRMAGQGEAVETSGLGPDPRSASYQP